MKSGVTTSIRQKKIKIIISQWEYNAQNRIAQIGLVNYASAGIRKQIMSRGVDDQVWRSITPATTNTYNLGSSTNKWGTVYATTFDGNATSATSTSQLTGIGANKFLIGQGTNSAVIGTSNMEYFNNENITIGSYTAKRNGFFIGGQCYGNDVNYITSSTAGEISFGDGGPQILFGDDATFSGSSQRGALIYTNNDTPSAGVSWHFVSNQSDWNVSSKRFTARTSVTIGAGTNKPNTSYNLHVTGTGYFTSALSCNGIAANIGGTNNAGGLSLWGTNPLEYGIAMRGTGNGKFGYVQSSNWAVYFSVNGPDSDPATTRGWIFRNHQTNSAVASISGGGNITTGGSVTVGGNATNTSGCEMVFDAATNSLNFTFK